MARPILGIGPKDLWRNIAKPSLSDSINMEADSSNRPKLFSPYVLPVFNVDLTGDGKLGYGFASADELEEIDIGPGDKPRPTFISKSRYLQSLERFGSGGT